MANTKMAELGWSPEWTWKQGLEATVQWYRENPEYWSNVDVALAPHFTQGEPPSSGQPGKGMEHELAL